nr:reverse transcriptase domain-containing protein [Tanacetum cinerariifolium]
MMAVGWGSRGCNGDEGGIVVRERWCGGDFGVVAALWWCYKWWGWGVRESDIGDRIDRLMGSLFGFAGKSPPEKFSGGGGGGRRRSNRRRVPNIVEPEIRTIKEIVPMADRTMEEQLQAPTEGYGEAIVIPKILVENFEIKTNLLQFVNQFFPPSKTTHLKNEISRFTQRFEETFGEAWDRSKEMLRACPHNAFSELTQIDTFYNGLNEQDQDSLNAAAGGNLLNETTREALKIIENKSKTHTNGDNDDDSDNDDAAESDDHDDASDDERTKSDSDEIPDPNLTNVDQTAYEEEDVDEGTRTPFGDEFTDEENLDDEETMDDEEDDEYLKELFEDVNVNLEKGDAEMTDANQRGSEQQNISQESEFKQEEEDAHVTLNPISDTQKADKPVQSSSASSDFTSKFLNLKNPSLADNEIVSLMETSAPHATAIPEITSGFTTTTPPLPSFFNPPLQQQTPTIPTPTFTTITPTHPIVSLPKIPNFKSVFKFDQRVSLLESKLYELKQTNQFAKVVSLVLSIVDKYIASKMKEAVNVAVQLQTNKLREESHTKNQDFLNQVDSTMKKIIKDQVKEQVSKMMPKIEKGSGKDAKSSKDLRSKEKKSSSTSKDASQLQHKSFGKSVHAKEPSHTVEESGMQQDQEFVTRDNDEQPVDKEVTKAYWFKKPKRPLIPDPDWSKRRQINF